MNVCSVCRGMCGGTYSRRRKALYGVWVEEGRRLRTFFRVCVCVNIYLELEKLGHKGKR